MEGQDKEEGEGRERNKIIKSPQPVPIENSVKEPSARKMCGVSPMYVLLVLNQKLWNGEVILEAQLGEEVKLH